jgi:transcriptional regulator with XRE-family HTH domain
LKAGTNRALRAGSPTIKEIATRLGVSHSTVSRALNDHHYTSRRTKEMVHAMAKELGYIANTAARAMRHARSSMVGLIIPDVENDFYAAVAKVTAAQLGPICWSEEAPPRQAKLNERRSIRAGRKGD